MILPNKYIQENEAILGVGAILLSNLSQQEDISVFWDKVKELPAVDNFERFVLSLDLLFALGLVETADGKIFKVAP